MSPETRAFESSIGTKVLIGLTGLALFLYLVTHIAGNVLVFFGPDVFNGYAHTLESNPLLPIVEIGLLLLFLLHIFKTVTMFLQNRRARPVPYQMKRRAGPPSRKTLASSTMILSGLWLLAFLVIHVKTFRFSPTYETVAGIRDLYRQEAEAFRSPIAVAFYVISMLLVGSHLWHGFASAFQSLGGDRPGWTPRPLVAGKIFAVLIAGGFIVIALWVHLTVGVP
jgi:succinate dehydrogenase / fumarate reductase cytochrome b subunit